MSANRTGAFFLIVLVVIGGLVVAGNRWPSVRAATDFVFQAIEILLFGVVAVVLIGGWYVQRTRPVAGSVQTPRRPAPNPHWRPLLIASGALAVGAGTLVLALAYAFKTEASPRSWAYLLGATLLFGFTLAIALPRLHRFAAHSAKQIARDLTGAQTRD